MTPAAMGARLRLSWPAGRQQARLSTAMRGWHATWRRCSTRWSWVAPRSPAPRWGPTRPSLRPGHPERVAALGLVTPAFDPAAILGASGGTGAVPGGASSGAARRRSRPARPGVARGWGGGVHPGLRLLHRAPAMARHGGTGPLAAPVAARAPRRHRRRDGSRFPFAALRGLRRAGRDRRSNRGRRLP